MRFADRAEAGRQLASRLESWRSTPKLVVLGLPRGGVPVAFEVAQRLRAPLDVFVVRKLGVPGQPELAMGAIASGGTLVLNPEVIAGLGIEEGPIDAAATREAAELQRHEQLFRGERAAIEVADATVLLIDDGMATGATMRAAARALRQVEPRRIVVAVPVASPEAVDQLGREADEVCCLRTPVDLMAVGAWYDDFSQVPDEEVQELLRRADQWRQGRALSRT